MAEDIGIELHDKIKQAFDARCRKDSTLSHIKRKIENGTATMEDTSVYARRLGELLRKSIESTTKPDDLPGEKMYFNIAQSILEPLLRNNYDDVNTICEEVQSALDAKKGIGLKSQKADFPAERIRAAIGGAAVKETAEHAIQVLGRTAENITGSFQTDYIKKNAEFRSKAGLNCYIERKDGHNCCDWCSKLAGRYRYPDEVPKDVYRRHDNCTCDVSYVSEKGRQNVHSKRWANEQAKAQRIEYAAGLPKPMKLTKAEAQAKQSEILAQRRLTYDAKRGIIYSLSNSSEKSYDPYSYEPKISKDVRVVFDSEFKRAEKKFGAISTVKGVYVLNDKSSDEGTYNEYSGFISLRHAEKKKGLQEMARIAREKYKEGKWSSGEPYHVIRHEIGHAIQSEHIRNDDRWDEKKKAILEVMHKAVNGEDGYKLPSKYSAQMPEEFISECIAASYKKSPGKTVNTVIRILNGGALNAGNA